VTHTEDQDVVGIHPEKMQALIGELKAVHRVIAAFAGEFSAPLSALGISVNPVHQSEHWTSDQVSKLTWRSPADPPLADPGHRRVPADPQPRRRPPAWTGPGREAPRQSPARGSPRREPDPEGPAGHPS
jgi:hypothetical protein